MGVTAWSSDRETAQQLFLANTKENERGKEATSRHDDGDTSSHSSSSAIRNDASSELWRGCPWPSSPARSQGRGSSYPDATCWTCHRQIVTDVSSEMTSSGMCFAFCCCIFGSWLASLLACCLPGFKKFTHRCPLCRALIGEGEPSHSGKHIALIIFVTILVLGLAAFVIATKIITRYY